MKTLKTETDTLVIALKSLSEATLREMKGDLLAAMDGVIEDQAEFDATERLYHAVKHALAGY